jgi:hypothetical protein
MKTALKISVLITVLALPGLASATYVENVTGVADCDGYTVNYCVRWGSALTANICYEAVLTDESGNVVATFENCEVLNNPAPGGPYPTVECGLWYMGVWDAGELCGNYTATVNVRMSATSSISGITEYSSGVFQASFLCDCPTEVCNYTPGYWKNHPENWPAMEMTLGGRTYDQVALLAIMDTPVRGDATVILAYHLIAAKLNVLSGSDPSINGAIAEADALLTTYPLKSKPGDPARSMILDVKNTLAGYNELECPDGPIDSGSKDLPDQTDSSWSDLKASYR